jgi:hypothetical protein
VWLSASCFDDLKIPGGYRGGYDFGESWHLVNVDLRHWTEEDPV